MCTHIEKRYPACRNGNTRVFFLYCIHHTVDPNTNQQRECNHVIIGAVRYAQANELCPFGWCHTCAEDRAAREAAQRPARLDYYKEYHKARRSKRR